MAAEVLAPVQAHFGNNLKDLYPVQMVFQGLLVHPVAGGLK